VVVGWLVNFVFMEKWLQLFTSESENGSFEFIHYSTSSIVRLMKVDADSEVVSEMYLDYNEFIELCDFIDKLRSKI
jgi:hypothetical protein